MRKLGEDPATGLEVTLRVGPLRPLHPARRGSERREAEARRHPEGLRRPTTSTLERALGLLSLPREVGKHPEDGEPILAGIGRFGPYVQHGKTYANLDTGDDVLTIGLNRAVTLIAEKRANPGKGRRFGADPGRPLGDHPQGRAGRGQEGPLRPLCQPRRRQRHAARTTSPETVTLEQAVPLLDARAAKTGAQARGAAQGAAQGCARAKPASRRQGREGRQGEEKGRRQALRERRQWSAAE